MSKYVYAILLGIAISSYYVVLVITMEVHKYTKDFNEVTAALIMALVANGIGGIASIPLLVKAWEIVEQRFIR